MGRKLGLIKLVLFLLQWYQAEVRIGNWIVREHNCYFHGLEMDPVDGIGSFVGFIHIRNIMYCC